MLQIRWENNPFRTTIELAKDAEDEVKTKTIMKCPSTVVLDLSVNIINEEKTKKLTLKQCQSEKILHSHDEKKINEIKLEKFILQATKIVQDSEKERSQGYSSPSCICISDS